MLTRLTRLVRVVCLSASRLTGCMDTLGQGVLEHRYGGDRAKVAGRASLGLTGRPIISTALTLERFGQMATGAWQGAQRVISPMRRRG